MKDNPILTSDLEFTFMGDKNHIDTNTPLAELKTLKDADARTVAAHIRRWLQQKHSDSPEVHEAITLMELAYKHLSELTAEKK